MQLKTNILKTLYFKISNQFLIIVVKNNCNRPKSPLELVNIIKSSEFIISHNNFKQIIIAYSCKIPSLAILWDHKILVFSKKLIEKAIVIIDVNSSNWYTSFKKILTCKDFNIDIKTHTIN